MMHQTYMFANLFTKIKQLPKKILVSIAVVIILLVTFFIWKGKSANMQSSQYQTATVTKGTLVNTVTAAGQVATANRVSVTTQASGVVKALYVKSGQTVNAGDKIADITLDNSGQQRQTQAWSAYLSAQNNLNQAQASMYTLQQNLFTTNQKFINDRGVNNPSAQQQADPVYIEENDAWLAAQAAYQNQSTVIAQAQANLSTAWKAYQAASATITAPSSGTIQDLTIAPGMQIGSANTSTTSTTSVSSQTIGDVVTPGNTILSVSVAEVDVAKVKTGEKVTITFDSIPDKTYSGTVTGVNTIGQTTSGVTTYPATIVLDSATNDIYAAMDATANIITKVDTDVLLVPTAAIHTTANGSYVTVLQNGNSTQIPVTTGDADDTQTVITSGLSEGQTVVTGTALQTTGSGSTTSPFSGGLRFGGGGFGGGAVIRGGGGGTGRGG